MELIHQCSQTAVLAIRGSVRVRAVTCFAHCRTNSKFIFRGRKNVHGYMFPCLKWQNSWSKWSYFKFYDREYSCLGRVRVWVLRLPNSKSSSSLVEKSVMFWGWNFFRAHPSTFLELGLQPKTVLVFMACRCFEWNLWSWFFRIYVAA